MAENSGHAKARFLATFRPERDKTLQLLRHFPADRADFKPAERSSTAHTLAWTFVVEQLFGLRAAKGEQVMGSPSGAPPETWDATVDEFQRVSDELIAALEQSDNDKLQGTASFYVAPKQVGDIPLEQFLWFMLHDQIHHRGQLSVYLRMVGATVPSIYGPSADEPWR